MASRSLEVEVGRDSIRIGERFELALQRTLRIPEDGRTYPLPPGLGRLPLLTAAEAGGRLPEGWRESGDVLAPLHRREAVWLAFAGASYKPNAVQIGAGRVNAVSGEPWSGELSGDPQDYVVVPVQPWMDGINSGSGSVRQFVAVPLGSGRSVEAQLEGGESEAALVARVYEPRPGLFPDEPPAEPPGMLALRAASPAMGLGAGGRIAQKLYPDPHGVDTWNPEHTGTARVRLVDAARWPELTGRPAPPTPVTAETYDRYGLPWFELYDDDKGDIGPGGRFEGLRGTADEPEEGTPADSVIGIRRDEER